jgi:UPF0755 protein
MTRDDRKKKRRRSGFLDVMNGLFGLAVLGLVAVVAVFLWGVSVFNAPGPAEQDAVFFVEPGNGTQTIAARLAEQGLINDATMFRAGAWVWDRVDDVRILPGEYAIPARASMQQIFDVIRSGKPIEYFVMVNPGQSSYEVAQLLNSPSENLSGDMVTVPPEGSILPIRHDYFPRDDRAALLKKMQDQMTAAVDRIWGECVANRPDVCGAEGTLKSKGEFIILASIVEKETGIASERPIVASLFINRLRRGMRLQTDPTILYGLYKGVPQERLIITKSQKEQATDYNTYVIDGLPPTPIANPGIAALEAVANPADTDYLYMMAKVPGDYTAGHHFAETLAEHQENERKYRRQEREQAGAAASASQ